jgi:VCBS repeat-containing protein
LTLNDSTGTGLGSIDFNYSAADGAFDFLAANEKLTITYDITVTDGNTFSTQPITITVTGSNDAPEVAAALGDIASEGAAGFSRNLLTDASDVDTGETATLYVADVTYAVDGGAASGTAPAGISLGADGHTLTVDPSNPTFNHLAVGQHAKIVVSYNVTDAHGATVAQTETITINGTNDAPLISIDQLVLTNNTDGTTTISGLSVADPDATFTETLTLQARTAGAASGSTVTPDSGSGVLTGVNTTLQSGIIYHPGSAPTDKVTLTVADGLGATDTVNFIFNVATTPATPVTLEGTTGKDVFFGTGYQDQFVFGANSNHDTIMNFTHGVDHVDLSAVVSTSNATTWFEQHVAASMNGLDTVVTVDAADTIVLRGVVAAILTPNDFILHAT